MLKVPSLIAGYNMEKPLNLLNFDGVDDEIQIDNKQIISGYPFTLVTWCNGSGTAIALEDNTVSNIYVTIGISKSNGYARVVKSNTTTRGAEIAPDLRNNRFHQIVGVFINPTLMYVYVDGNHASSATFEASDFTTLNRISIGNRSTSALEWFNGAITNTRVYNYALSSEEIKNLYLSERLSPTSGLVGYWSLNEGTGIIVNDLSPNLNHGEISGASWSKGFFDNSYNWNNGNIYGPILVEGKIGHAYLFDGLDDYIEVPHSTELNTPNDITISMWIKASIGTASRIISKFTTSPNRAWEISLDATGKINWRTSYNGSLDESMLSIGTIPNNEWIHIVCQKTGTLKTIYFNTILDNSLTTSYAGIYSNTLNLFIGRYAGTTGGFFSGLISDVKLFNKPILESDIQRLYLGLHPIG